MRRSKSMIAIILATVMIFSWSTVSLAETAARESATSGAGQTAPTVQANTNELLPGEDMIQKELTPEDIKRLQSYSYSYGHVDANGKNEIRTDRGDFGCRPDDINYAPIDSYVDIARAMQNDLWNLDYMKLENPGYAEEYYHKGIKYLGTDLNGENNSLKKYIADAIANKLKIKTYLLVSKDTTFGSIGLAYVRGKYIFYQESGNKIEEPGSTLNEWYWQDIEIPLVTFANQPRTTTRERRTPEWYKSNVDVILLWGSGIKKLNEPQPYKPATLPIKVYYNNTLLAFDTQPVMINGRVMVPIRPVANAMDAKVNWEPATQTVGLSIGNTNVLMKIGENMANINSTQKQLDVPAQIIDGRTLVPLRFISEGLGAEVNWEDQTQTATIEYGN